MGIARYVLLTYLVTWSFTAPLAWLWRNVLDQQLVWWLVVFLPGAWGPTIAALILTRREEGRAGVVALLRKLLAWRAAPSWYAFALLTPPAVVAASLALLAPGWDLAGPVEPLAGLAIAPLALVAALPFGPLAEELGWRGYALPRLLAAQGPWRASLVLGLVWTFWHLPMFWFPGAAIPSFVEPGAKSIALYAAQITAEAALMTFLWIRSGGSVPLAVVYHAAFNTAETIVLRAVPELNAAQELRLWITSIALSWMLAVALLARLRPNRLGGHAS